MTVTLSNSSDTTGTLDPLARLREGVKKNPRARRAELAMYLESVAPRDKIAFKHDPTDGRYGCSVDMWLTRSRTPIWVVGDLTSIRLWCIDRDAFVVQQKVGAARGWVLITGALKCFGASEPQSLISDLRVARVVDDHDMGKFTAAVKEAV